MPIEVLTREDVEKVVEEKLKKLFLEMKISKRITGLESAAAKLHDDLGKLSLHKAAIAHVEPVAVALTEDLAERADLLQIRATSDSVTLRPKNYLATHTEKSLHRPKN